MSDDSKKKLTSKQQRFVQGYAMGLSGSDAVKAANYDVASNQNASSIASQLLSKDHVQDALRIAIASQFPDIHRVSAQTIYGILTSENSTATEKLKAIDTLCKVFDWLATAQPKQDNRNIQSIWKLPEE